MVAASNDILCLRRFRAALSDPTQMLNSRICLPLTAIGIVINDPLDSHYNRNRVATDKKQAGVRDCDPSPPPVFCQRLRLLRKDNRDGHRRLGYQAGGAQFAAALVDGELDNRVAFLVEGVKPRRGGIKVEAARKLNVFEG